MAAATFLLALPALLIPAAALEEGPVAQTPHGKVRGFSANGTKAWRGIPYAAPPVGDLRFRPPAPVTPWNDTLNALDFGPSCLQMGSPSVPGYGAAWNSLNLTKSSEDCLYLNVYAPEGVDGPLPVMVYFHAGEFRFGAANDWESNWPHFAKGSVILVTAGVRLGLFGFGALDAFRARDPAGSAGNYGMQDGRAVLQWVRRSIGAFGGDPERVTIFGESSGGASVAFHVTSPKSNGLFHRAILQSPGLTQSKAWEEMVANTEYAASILASVGSPACSFAHPAEWRVFPGLSAVGKKKLAVVPSLTWAKILCQAKPECYLLSADQHGITTLYGFGDLGTGVGVFLVNVTFNTGRDPGVSVLVRRPNAGTVVDCLVAANASDLVNGNIAPPFDDTFYTDAAAPTEDGVELPAPLVHLSRCAVPPGMAILAGSNQDEGTEFMSECPNLPCNASEEAFQRWALKMYGPELGARVPQVYQDLQEPTPLCRKGGPDLQGRRLGEPQETSKAWVKAMRSAGDDAILCRTRELLRSAARTGSPVWWYYFTATPLFSVNEPESSLPYMGAFHGAEVPFVFGDGFEFRSDGERRLSKAMGCYWTNFAATGDPNRGPSKCASELALPDWPSFHAGSAISFSNTSIGARRHHKKEQCDLFVQFSEKCTPHLLMV